MCLKLIFRKLSDVKREKELEEKRKLTHGESNDKNGLVRKMASRIRKFSIINANNQEISASNYCLV